MLRYGFAIVEYLSGKERFGSLRSIYRLETRNGSRRDHKHRPVPLCNIGNSHFVSQINAVGHVALV